MKVPPRPSTERTAPPLEPVPGGGIALTLAVGTIIIALIFLVTVPALVARNVAELRDQLEFINVTAIEARELSLGLAQELNILRDFENTPSWAEEFRLIRARVQGTMARLDSLSLRFPSDEPSDWYQARNEVLEWHQEVDAELARAVGEISVTAPPLGAIAITQESLSAARALVLRRLAREERLGLVLGLALALMAFLAVLLVVWLGRRVRVYAEKAREQNRLALQATAARTRLMRGFSHDLRNPLANVRISIDMLEMGMYGHLGEPQREALARIKRATDRALSLLDDLVELSRAESGQLELNPILIEPERVASAVVDQFVPRAQEAGLDLTMVRARDVPRVMADEARVRQILENLIGNAINYTPQGGRVTVTVGTAQMAPRGEAQTGVTFSVQDTGPGIPAEDIPRIFEEFVRLGDSGQGGSGIGLAISRQLARLMGGTIEVESVEGQGSTFTLFLPAP